MAERLDPPVRTYCLPENPLTPARHPEHWRVAEQAQPGFQTGSYNLSENPLTPARHPEHWQVAEQAQPGFRTGS